MLGAILNDLDKGRFDLLVVARLDRLGRCTADVLGVADRALRNGWDIALLDIFDRHLDADRQAGLDDAGGDSGV